MKKIFSIFSIGLSMLAFSSLTTGCVEEVPEVIDKLELSNMLTPSSISGLVDASTGTTVTFTWTNSNAVVYHLEVYGFDTDEAPAAGTEITEEMLAGMTPVVDEYVDPSESGSSTSYTAEDLEPEMSYYARVCAQSSADPDTKTAGDSKWAYVYPIDTYSVMDQLPSFSVKERTSSTITVAWTLAEGDKDGINQIRVTPHPTDASQAFLRVDVAPGATEATIGDGDVKLNPSERYTVALHYNSANRGQMFVWTTPDWTGVQDAADTAALKQLLREAGNPAAENQGQPLRIRLTNTETPYDLDGTADVLGPVEILGAQTTDGESPVIIGGFVAQPPLETYTYWNSANSPVSNTVGATSIRLEAIEFDGDGYSIERPFRLGDAFPAEKAISVSIVNCDIHTYSAGFFYDGDKVAAFDKILINNNTVSDIQGKGGDGFDIRKATSVGSIEITGNTFSNGMRTFIRIDNGTLGSLNFANNTVNNLVGVDDGNNKGLFNIRATLSGTFTITKNLFLNLNGCPTRTVMFPAQATAFPTAVSGNYYYNLTDIFFYADSENKVAADEFPEASAVAGGGAVLSSDPCVNSARGIFNVTDASVSNAQAGDPRWLVAYVPQPMADLEPVEYGHEWTLNSTSTYGKTIEETTVIANTKFIVDSNPINIVDEGMEFSAEATLEYSGVPADCAISFLVDGLGSIFASALQSTSGTVNDHITVAVGPADGSSATVVAAIPAGAYNQKVVFDDIDGESLIYLYACGPIVLSGLEWSDDVNTGSSALPDPEVTFDNTTAGALTLSWNPVANAGSYIISFGVKEPDAEYAEDEYIIEGITTTSYTWENFPSGTYTVNVQAVPAEPEKFSNSLIVGTTVTVTAPATMPQLTSANLTQDDMAFLYAVTEGANIGEEINGVVELPSIYYKGFLFTGRSGKVSKFNSSVYGAFFNTGGGSDVSDDNAGRTIRFVAGGAGKLSYVVVSNGTDVRTHAVSVNYTEAAKLGETRPQPSSMPSSWADDTYTHELSTSAGDVIDLYSTKSVNYISVTWEPAGGLPPVAGLTPVTETTTWGGTEWGQLYSDYGTAAGYGKDFYITDAEYYVVNNLMIYAGGADTKFRVGSDNEYIQLASSSFGSSAQPSEYYRCFLRFRASGNGTLTLSARHTSGTADSPGARYIYVSVGGAADAVPAGTVLEDAFDAGIYTTFTEHTWNITANNGDAITIFENNALRIDKITWTPAE